MAEITNKVKKIDRKKDLYDHVSFDELYSYNQPISNLRELSRKLFTQYIMSGVQHWRNELGFAKGYLGVDFGLFRGDTEHELFTVPIVDLKDEFVGDANAPTELAFSVIEIVEPFDVVYSKEHEGTRLTSELKSFIDLGLYPLVVSPMRESEIYDSFEKYDDVVHGYAAIGTIVDINEFPEGDSVIHYVATIMWDPNYGRETTKELILSKNGYLVLRNLVRTPTQWREPNENLVTNFGIPIYEYQAMRSDLAIINNVDGFNAYINEAVVTGHLDLDFVRSALNMATATAEKVNEQHQAIMSGAKWQKDLTPQSPSVDVIDASENDDFGHRLHLYDEPMTPDTDDDDFEIG